MIVIPTYTNTKCELEILRTRLDLCLSRKEQIFYKYFPLTVKMKDVLNGNHNNNDMMASFLHEYHEIDIGTGQSLADEIKTLTFEVNRLSNVLYQMKISLEEMKGVCYNLYSYVVNDGYHISKAVRKVAEETGKDENTIWVNYYPKIKKELKKIKKFTNIK